MLQGYRHGMQMMLLNEQLGAGGALSLPPTRSGRPETGSGTKPDAPPRPFAIWTGDMEAIRRNLSFLYKVVTGIFSL